MHAMGIKNVIITDHHAITDKGTTNADAFINPQRGCPELEWMCGAHVVLKLLSGLYIEDTKEYVFDNLYRPCLPHAALATVCDVVNLDTKYNRDCIRAGVMFMNADNFLWKKLVDKLGLSCKVCYKDLGFKLGPFVNTGNRTSTEELFYSILVETDSDKLDILIDQGCSLNISRKKVRQRAMVDIAKNITVKPGAKSLCYIVDVPMAINGVIASSLGGVYNIPVICFSLIKETGILSGSARANVKGVSIVDAFNYIKKKDSSVILAGGGHPGAGGCTISFDKFESFKELFEEAVSTMQVDTKDDKLIINFNTKYLNYGIVEEIDYCGPYGAKWQQPLLKGAFKVKKVYVYSSIIMLDVIAANGMLFKCTYFNDNVSDFNIVSGDVIIVTFEPQYYKRGKLVSLSLLIDEFCEVK